MEVLHSHRRNLTAVIKRHRAMNECIHPEDTPELYLSQPVIHNG
jgi:hypothetical protein